MTRSRTLACKQLVELVSAYLEGALGPADRLRVEEHLSVCGDCEAYLSQLQLTIALSNRAVVTSKADDLLATRVIAQLLDDFRPPNEQDGPSD